MNKLFTLCALALLCAANASAQSRPAPRLDNFDTESGVRLHTPPVTDRLPAKKIRLTANTVPAGVAAVSAKPGAGVQPATTMRPRLVHSAPSASPLSSAGGAAALRGYTTGDAGVDRMIAESGARNSVDPVLLYAIMHQESAFKKGAVSHAGARGLMQLMPATARRFGVTDIFDPRQNIEGGARYMRVLLNMFDGDVRLALAGYNAGEGAVLKYGRQVPTYSETREYVRRIGARYALMRDPQAARHAPAVTPLQAARIEQEAQSEAPAPAAPSYERSVYSVRLSNGQLMLVTQ